MSKRQRAETMAALASVDAPITLTEQHNVMTLASLAKTINARFDAAATADTQAYDARIVAGKMLMDARTRIESALAEHGTFLQWCKLNIKRSKADIYRCIKLASSDDPTRAHEIEKAAARVGMARGRERDTAIIAAATKQAAVSKLETSTPKPSPNVWGDVTVGLPASTTRDLAVATQASELSHKSGPELATHIETQIRLLSDVQWITISDSRRTEIVRLIHKMIERARPTCTGQES